MSEMSCCGVFENSERKLAKQINKLVEKKLKKEKIEYKNEIKLLILGAGESGKSTFLKQLRIIHGDGYRENEKISYINAIRCNVFYNINCVIEVALNNGLSTDERSVRSAIEQLKSIDIEKDKRFESYIESIHFICQKKIVKDVIANSHFYRLPDSTEYFLNEDNIHKILKDSYLPDVEDIIRLRVPTTGIVEFDFSISHVHFRMVDVGGQRSERRKWIHCFDNVTSIIFVVAISEYDQTLIEDPTQNRMVESIALFKTIISYPAFLKISIILFLNKIDIFERKVKVSPLSKVFPEYTGEDDPEMAKAFILKKFLDSNPYEDKPIYSHFTCATDTRNIGFVFEAVRDTILRQNLAEYNLA